MMSTARSLLFVPADHPRRLDRAWDTAADGVIADLEYGRPRGALCVRINALDTEHAQADLALVARCPDVDAVMVPKASAAALAALRSPDRPLIALVETAAGLLEAPAIAACPGVARLMLGTVDLAAELGVEITVDAAVFVHARAALVLASAAASLPGPIDGVWTDVGDEAGLRGEARAARATGFTGKACIHPAQLEAVRDVFSPTAQQLATARRIVDEAEAGLAAGHGVVSVDGRMVDRPVLERARRLLDHADERSSL